jgi:CRISPR-associated endoribonuclease Cas6
MGSYYHKAQISPFAIKEIVSNPDGTVHIHFVFLDYRVMLEFMRETYAAKKIRLGTVHYTVVKTAVHPDNHPNAGMISYDSFDQLPLADRFIMNFKYTAFSSDHKTDVLPSPDKVVRSLLNKWNASSSDAIDHDEEYIKKLASGMLITSHNIYTSLYQIRNDISLTTFSGKVGYEISHNDHHCKKLLNKLLHFSQYSGVGWKCSYGMGRVEIKTLQQQSKKDSIDKEVLVQ